MLDGLASELPDDADPAAGLDGMDVNAIRSLLERACVSAALTCERAGAETPDARTLADAVKSAQSHQYGPATS
jgi:hypothetical protein